MDVPAIDWLSSRRPSPVRTSAFASSDVRLHPDANDELAHAYHDHHVDETFLYRMDSRKASRQYEYVDDFLERQRGRIVYHTHRIRNAALHGE